MTAEERRELSDLRLAADWLMLRKAYAWAVLRWRNHSILALDSYHWNNLPAVPDKVRQYVSDDAGHRCEYCRKCLLLYELAQKEAASAWNWLFTEEVVLYD